MATARVAERIVDSAQEIAAAGREGVILASRPQGFDFKDLTKVRVRVKEQIGGEITITSTHAPGTTEAIAMHMPTLKMQRRVMSQISWAGRNLRDNIQRMGAAIPHEVWAKAIASEIISRLGQKPDIEVEMNAVSKGGYLALDTGVYRLTPVECAPLNKAASAVRRRVMEKAEVDAAKVMKVAKDQSDALIKAANERVAEAEKRRRELEIQQDSLPPSWLLTLAGTGEVPIRLRGPQWYWGFHANIRHDQYIYEWELPVGPDGARKKRVRRWNSVSNAEYHALYWHPALTDAAFVDKKIFIDSNYRQPPHVSHNSGCMALGETRPTIKTLDDIATIKLVFQRTMRKVALHSLYVYGDSWPKVLQDTLPPAIKNIVLAHDLRQLMAPTLACDHQEDITFAQEAAETWTTTR